jgi:hypothetical protein
MMSMGEILQYDIKMRQDKRAELILIFDGWFGAILLGRKIKMTNQEIRKV